MRGLYLDEIKLPIYLKSIFTEDVNCFTHTSVKRNPKTFENRNSNGIKQFLPNVRVDKPLANRLSRTTKRPDYRRRWSSESLSPAHPVYFSQIKISQSGLRLAGWCVRERWGGLWAWWGLGLRLPAVRGCWVGRRHARRANRNVVPSAVTMLDIKSSADYLSRSGTFTNFSMLFAGEYIFY